MACNAAKITLFNSVRTALRKSLRQHVHIVESNESFNLPCQRLYSLNSSVQIKLENTGEHLSGILHCKIKTVEPTSNFKATSFSMFLSSVNLFLLEILNFLLYKLKITS